MNLPLQLLANGLVNGALFGVLACAFGLVYRSARVFHIAFAGLFLVGPYAAYAANTWLGFPNWAAIAIGVLVAAGAGYGIERILYRPFLRRNATAGAVLIASLGAFIIIENLLALLFGNEIRMIDRGLARRIPLGPVSLTSIQVIQFAVCTLALIGLGMAIRKIRAFKAIWAMGDEPGLIPVLGLPLMRYRATVFALSAGLGGLAGCLIGLDVGIDPHMLGVRGSFMAMDMKALAERSADAKARFTLLREVAAAKRTADPASVEFLDDWIVLNEVIGEDDATLAWFDRVKMGEGEGASETKMLGGVSFRIVGLLLAKDRLADVVRLYPDPLAEIRSDFELSAEMARRQPALPDFLDEATKESVRAQPWTQFREKVAVLYAGFLAAGKDEKAAEIMAEARKLYDRPRLVTGVIGFAVEKGQARPAMNGLLDDAEKAGADVKELRAQLEKALAEKK